MDDVLVQTIACKQPFLSFFHKNETFFFLEIIVVLMVGKVKNATNV